MMKSWPLPSKLQFLGPGDYDSLDFTDLLLPYIPRWVKENYTTHHICPVFAWKIHMVSRWIDPGHGLSFLRSRVLPTESDVPTHGDRTLGKPQISSWRLWGKIYEALRRTFKFSSHSFLINFTYIIPKGCQGNPKMQRFWQQLSYDGQWNKAGLCSQQPSYKGGNWVNKEWKSLISYPCVPDLPILGWSNPPGSKNAGDVGGSLREEQ